MGGFLTEVQKQELKALRKTEKDLRTVDRIRTILLADRGWAYKEIAEVFFVDEETVSKHVKEYIEKEKLSIESGGSESKLSEQQTQELIAHCEENTFVKV